MKIYAALQLAYVGLLCELTNFKATYCLETGWANFQYSIGCSHFLFAKDFFDLGEI